MAEVNQPGFEQVQAEVVESGGAHQIQIVEVAAGGSVPLHSHNVDASFVVIDGSGTFLSADGNERPVQQGDAVHVPANEPHGWRSGRGSLRFASISNEPGIYQGADGEDGEGEWDITPSE